MAYPFSSRPPWLPGSLRVPFLFSGDSLPSSAASPNLSVLRNRAGRRESASRRGPAVRRAPRVDGRPCMRRASRARRDAREGACSRARGSGRHITEWFALVPESYEPAGGLPGVSVPGGLDRSESREAALTAAAVEGRSASVSPRVNVHRKRRHCPTPCLLLPPGAGERGGVPAVFSTAPGQRAARRCPYAVRPGAAYAYLLAVVCCGARFVTVPEACRSGRSRTSAPRVEARCSALPGLCVAATVAGLAAAAGRDQARDLLRGSLPRPTRA